MNKEECGKPPALPLRGGQRPTWRPEREARGSALGVQSREGSHVDRTRHCRGADSRARRRTYSPYKPPSKWQTLPTCHCEAPKGPWQSRSTWPDNKMAPAKTQLPARDSHVASLLGMTRQAGAVVHQCPSAVELSPTRRSMSAATDAIGAYHFIGSWFASAVPSRDCHVASLLAMTRQGSARCTSALLRFNSPVQGARSP